MPVAVSSKFCRSPPLPRWPSWPHVQTKPQHPRQQHLPQHRPKRQRRHQRRHQQHLRLQKRQQRQRQPPAQHPICPWSIRKTQPLWLWVMPPKPAKPMWPSTRNTQPVRTATIASSSAAKRAMPPVRARCLLANRSVPKAGAVPTRRKRVDRTRGNLTQVYPKPPHGGFLLSNREFK